MTFPLFPKQVGTAEKTTWTTRTSLGSTGKQLEKPATSPTSTQIS